MKDINEKLIDAVEKGNVKLAEKLITNGADVSLGDELPLRMALEKENGKMVRMLVKKGANINVKDKNGKTLSQLALFSGSLKRIKILIDNNINLNLDGKFGNALLTLAINERDKELVTKLIDRGVNVNIKPEDGMLYDKEISKILINNGAKINKDFDVRIYGGENTREIADIIDRLLKQEKSLLKEGIKKVDVVCVKRSKFEPNKYKVILRKDDDKAHKRYLCKWENSKYCFEEKKKRVKPLFFAPIFKLRKIIKKLYRHAAMETYQYEKPKSLENQIQKEKNVQKNISI